MFYTTVHQFLHEYIINNVQHKPQNMYIHSKMWPVIRKVKETIETDAKITQMLELADRDLKCLL